MNDNPLVGIVMGSESDYEIMRKAGEMLDKFDIAYEMDVISAHRSPRLAVKYAEEAVTKGLRVIIAGAGKAAHLAGVLAAHTTIPVIGVPISSEELKGMDALFSMVQMPAGIPVGTMALGSSGAKNAALFAAEIISLSDSKLFDKLLNYRNLLEEEVLAASERIKKASKEKR
ncbi:MAG: 5-(carboxyamino)imidazole ribonucleotide mutase [bacterium]|nr:5-(carboxyamino)imidazole ribonucleotide mutase [bacterium]